ncbi:hypothetical protein K525DRAFT_258558 [Schizophyllum commune Loenen D]|nr:hypothetical protein K525DRAFT_258558 [Schizophyllum commune Loenen D]
MSSGVLVSRDEHCAVESTCSHGHLADSTSTSTPLYNAVPDPSSFCIGQCTYSCVIEVL